MIRQSPTSVLRSRLAPQNAFGYVNRGDCRRQKGDHDGAIADLTKALRLDPKNATAYLDRAMSWRPKREYDRAIQDIGKAIRLAPEHFLETGKRGGVYVTTSTGNSLRPELYGKTGPDQFATIAHLQRGLCRTLTGHYEGALADYAAAIRLARGAYPAARRASLAPAPLAPTRSAATGSGPSSPARRVRIDGVEEFLQPRPSRRRLCGDGRLRRRGRVRGEGPGPVRNGRERYWRPGATGSIQAAPTVPVGP